MNNIQKEILSDLRTAKRSIKVAVSWLTDVVLINELIAANRRGVQVQVIVSSNEVNIKHFELFQELISNGAVVNKEGSEDPLSGQFMHYKFYIVDDTFSKSGSYNWSANAITNRETLDDASVQKKLLQFNECYKESINFFKDIDNPEQKKKELALIEQSVKEVLTPEKLMAYRQAQKLLAEQELKHKQEIETKEKERKLAEERAEKERKEKERLIEEQKKNETNKFGMKKDAPAVSEAPPTSYAI